MKRSQPGEVQGRVCQLEGRDCAKPQTQEDQEIDEELNTDQCGWKVGGEPGKVGRGWITQDLIGCNGELLGVFSKE